MAKRRSGNSKGDNGVDETMPPGKRSRQDRGEDEDHEFVRPKPPMDMDATPALCGSSSQNSGSLDETSSNEMDCSQNPDFAVQVIRRKTC